ncbi:MAG: hypothetical protein M3Z03_08605, partial [Actinomycetota bacterium]|nr:hypothetical protein [Actinomycetota bacterium]
GENGWHRQLIVTDGEARHAKAVTDPDDNAEAPTFSPDGSQVAYAVGIGDYESAGPGGYAIWIVDVDGDEPRRITGPPNWGPDMGPAGSDQEPDWSPARDDIAYAHYGRAPGPVTAGEANGIYVVTPAGGLPRRLTTPGFDEYDHRPMWSPDGGHVAFVRTHVPRALDGTRAGARLAGLWVVARDGSRPRLVAELPLGDEPMAWHPDGTSLWLGGRPSFTENPGLPARSVDLATGEQAPLGPPLDAIAWSPGGAHRYTTAREANPPGVWRITATDEVAREFVPPRGLPLGRDLDLATC